ncbi:MAG: ester cyclase [Cytophagales bacterium]|nr:ester cyclase [Cytophagales bacterium]
MHPLSGPAVTVTWILVCLLNCRAHSSKGPFGPPGPYDFHDNTLPKGRPQGYKGILFASANFRKAVPDLRCTVEDLIIAGDKIVCRMVFTGHNTGPLNGHPPSGREVRFIAIDVLHVRGGKVFEDWHLEDNLTFLQQTGVVPAP